MVHKNFENNHVLKGISFAAKSGAAFGLLGRNGSEKTNTLRIIMNIFTSDSGKVLIDGAARKKLEALIGYLPEERGMYPKRIVSDQMIYLGRLKGLSARDTKTGAEKLLVVCNCEARYSSTLRIYKMLSQ